MSGSVRLGAEAGHTIARRDISPPRSGKIPPPGPASEDFARVRDLAVSGRIRPVLAGTCPLEDIARAQADFVAKDFIGKLVITTEKAK